MIILGIESSCDETAAAVLRVDRGKFNILSNIVSSQIDIHKPFGGVVPELAARNHLKNILPVINSALKQAKITPKKIDHLAVTNGPGLITALLIGIQAAKTLSEVWQKPLVAVNHLKGHIYSAWLKNKPIKFPALGLIVSGGHTELILIKNTKTLKKIGQTLDDAAGESFDKVAKLLNLGYPGGPIISQLAELGNNQAFAFPRPMIDENNFNFSFAGLKTAVLYTRNKIKKLSKKTKADFAASFQQAVIDVLVSKTMKAAKHYWVKTIIMAGGVAANKLLRQSLNLAAAQEKLPLIVPPINLCTDNASIIAAAAYFEKPTKAEKIKVNPNLEIK